MEGGKYGLGGSARLGLGSRLRSLLGSAQLGLRLGLQLDSSQLTVRLDSACGSRLGSSQLMVRLGWICLWLAARLGLLVARGSAGNGSRVGSAWNRGDHEHRSSAFDDGMLRGLEESDDRFRFNAAESGRASADAVE